MITANSPFLPNLWLNHRILFWNMVSDLLDQINNEKKSEMKDTQVDSLIGFFLYNSPRHQFNQLRNILPSNRIILFHIHHQNRLDSCTNPPSIHPTRRATLAFPTIRPTIPTTPITKCLTNQFGYFTCLAIDG